MFKLSNAEKITNIELRLEWQRFKKTGNSRFIGVQVTSISPYMCRTYSTVHANMSVSFSIQNAQTGNRKISFLWALVIWATQNQQNT